jgi:C1A family cysteine protease
MINVKDEAAKGWLCESYDISDNPKTLKPTAQLKEWFQPKIIRGKVNVFPQVPPKHDLRDYFSEVENQGSLKSCTACAVVGLVEYFQRRFSSYNDSRQIGESEKLFNVSKLFLYQVARKEMGHGFDADEGASIRATMRALVKYGLPPENDWQYDDQNMSKDPIQNPEVMRLAKDYKEKYIPDLEYFRIDTSNNQQINSEKLLDYLKRYLLIGIPVVFGFQSSEACLQQAVDETNDLNRHPSQPKGGIPLPSDDEIQPGSPGDLVRGHAVVAVGYDESIQIQNRRNGTKTNPGAFIIRNSFGKTWGEDGYGYLPYDYVRKGLTHDWWTLLQKSWIEGWQDTISEGEVNLLFSGGPPDRP